MVLLFSTDPDGICHIETSGLDGESNLKQRQVVRGCAEQVDYMFSVGDINFFFLENDKLIFACINKEILTFIFPVKNRIPEGSIQLPVSVEVCYIF